ncbi:C-type lectin domain family 5 member A-like isoform X2 [Pithys albifrons albifrons]|uniref:C-type lectin domain family 5 member A-like isoform X2 n=1 Tax=Pithys albifrons albifrons TaxID=3385563 RepID=UPI003A5CC4F5
MAENVIYADLNLSESATPRVQQVSDVSGKGCGSRTRVAVLVAVLVVTVLLVVAGWLMGKYYPTASSQQQSTALSPNPEEALGCPPKWKKHGRKCYFFPPNKQKDWNASRAECTAMSADLVIIDSKDELVYLMEQSKDTYYFLGLRYSVMEQKWKWINNVEHDPALFNLIRLDQGYLCACIGYGYVSAAPCDGATIVQNMCGKAAIISEKQKDS